MITPIIKGCTSSRKLGNETMNKSPDSHSNSLDLCYLTFSQWALGGTDIWGADLED